MDNARKKYVIIKRLSSGDVFALLDSMESDAEGDLENIMNDSDTEFVAEDESVISTNIIRKEEIGDQSRFVSVPEGSIHIFSTQNEDESDTLVQDEPNSAPATECTSNQSPSRANQRTSNQSPAVVTQRTADQSPATVVNRRISNQSFKFTPSSTVTLPKSSKKWEQSPMIKDKMEKKKVNVLFNENNTDQKKGSVPQGEDKTKKEKTRSRN